MHICHIYREANQVEDELANVAVTSANTLPVSLHILQLLYLHNRFNYEKENYRFNFLSNQTADTLASHIHKYKEFKEGQSRH